MHLLSAFAASYVYVCLKAFQQLNVQHDAYRWIIPVSMLMALAEVLLTTLIVVSGVGWIVLAIGFGSGFGALTAMHIHRRLRARKDSHV